MKDFVGIGIAADSVGIAADSVGIAVDSVGIAVDSAVYDETNRDPDTGEESKETWLRICGLFLVGGWVGFFFETRHSA